MSYRPIPTSTVYSSKLFRRPEVQEAFDKIERLPDASVREAARHSLIALVSGVSEIAQSIDDLNTEVASIARSVAEVHSSLSEVHDKLDLLLKDK